MPRFKRYEKDKDNDKDKDKDKEMGRIQTAINVQVEGYDDDDDDGGGGFQSGDEGYFGDGDH